MKSFLKTISALLLLLVAAGGAWGQPFTPQDFLNVRALNVGTNIYTITNLANVVTNVGMIYNPSNITYTNLQGTYVGSSTSYLGSFGTTNPNTTYKLFNDVDLYPDRNGNFPFNMKQETSAAGLVTNFTFIGNQTLLIEYVNPLVTNAAVGLQFRPIWDGETPNSYTADDWWVLIGATLGVQRPKGILATNIPTWQWPGAKKLRLVAITNSTVPVGAGPAIQTNSTFLTKVRAVGFKP